MPREALRFEVLGPCRGLLAMTMGRTIAEVRRGSQSPSVPRSRSARRLSASIHSARSRAENTYLPAT